LSARSRKATESIDSADAAGASAKKNPTPAESTGEAPSRGRGRPKGLISPKKAAASKTTDASPAKIPSMKKQASVAPAETTAKSSTNRKGASKQNADGPDDLTYFDLDTDLAKLGNNRHRNEINENPSFFSLFLKKKS
jgi:hypothetical protein